MMRAWTAGSQPAYVASMNLHRRHLDPGQRGLIAAEIRARAASGNFTLSQDIDESGEKSGMSFSEAAAAVQVGERTARDVKLVLGKGTDRKSRR